MYWPGKVDPLRFDPSGSGTLVAAVVTATAAITLLALAFVLAFALAFAFAGIGRVERAVDLEVINPLVVILTPNLLRRRTSGCTALRAVGGNVAQFAA